nr:MULTISPECIES: sigma 54-interacting transcriptional regulator [unclassified Fusibacter]
MLTHFDTIEGSSKTIRGAINIAMRAAMSSSTVLIQGESGTGKELFARAIHNHSARADCAFVAINCGAIPENLLESELFGYESGAFTGANTKGKPGKFELADGGTLFLDEIGDMPLNLQVKLLRVLQERAVERLGSSEPTPIDVRIICATHRDLELMVKEGEFREDLYYRIQVLPVMIPPLRERTEDIPDLVKQLVKRKKERLSIGRNITVSDEVMKMFMTHRWTGNIRELENVIEYSLNIDTDGIVTSEDLPNRFYGQGSRRKSDRGFMTLQQMEHDLIKSAISHYGTHKEGIVQICNVLGISRATLYRKMKEI